MMAKKAPNPIDKHVGSRVRMRRMMLGMSQEKLGDALGLTFQQVQKYEKGTNRIGASRLQQISHILQVPVSFFFEGAPNCSDPDRGDGMGEAPSPAYVSDFLATSDGLALTKAFMRIDDSKLRRRIVDLVEQIAAARSAEAFAPRRQPPRPRYAHFRPHLDRAGGRCNNHLQLTRGLTPCAGYFAKPATSDADFKVSLRGECFAVARTNYLFTSESVSEGHPDKVCDQISDAILDAFIENDIKLGIADESQVNTRLGCETLCTTNKIVIAGEGRGQAPLFHKHGDKAVVNREMITEIARGVVKDIGYDQDGFSYYGADVEVLLHGQSPDIAMGVNAKKKKSGEQEGAGDQGMMFGFACTESEVYEKGSFMPAPIYFAHKILKVLSDKRRSGAAVRSAARRQEPGHREICRRQAGRLHQGRGLDAAQCADPQRQEIHARHGQGDDRATRSNRRCRKAGCRRSRAISWSIPTGNFVVGGPDGDCGLTGRKIIVDTYGGYAPHGGGAFSGKDPTKVDRSAAYAARYLAKNVVAAGLAERCTIQIAYAIGVADPMSLLVDTHGTGKVEEAKLQKLLPELFPLRPTNIRRALKLSRPIYRRTAAYGHFGRAPEKDGGFSWERTDLADALKRALR